MIRKLKHYFMQRSRERKYREFISLFEPSHDSTILDVGVADKEYSPFDNYLEKKYPYPDRITALSIYPLTEFKKRYSRVNAVTYEGGGKFPFKDKEFSIIYSNAVIEHVGGFSEKIDFIREMHRCAFSIYFTTPAREFPWEMHTNYPFIHWLPQKTRDRFLRASGKSWATGNYMNLLRKKDIVDLLKEAQVKEFKIFTHRFGPFPLHYAVWGSDSE